MKEKIILTFDLEFWYNSGFLKKYLPKNRNFHDDYIVKSIEPILNLLKKCGHRATFFVLGQAAEEYPELIKKISDSGHEICSHGYSHIPLFELDEEKFEREIILTNNIIKKIIGKKALGFRAPNFSLNKKTSWAKNVVDKNFDYSSSIHPFSFSKKYGGQKEFIPSLGGFYFRIFPLWLFIFFIKNFSRSNIPILYFHPYELFESSPKINSAPWYKRKIKYWGTKTAWKKFENLMEQFEFISIRQYFDL